MKMRVGLYVVGLLALLGTGVLGCGSEAPEDGLLPPAAPTGVTAAVVNDVVTVTWTAPESDGGTPITAYLVQVFQGSTVVKEERTPPTRTSITFTDLPLGGDYTVVVTAVNGKGPGAASSPSAAVRPLRPLGAPRNVTVTPANTQVTVSWSAPEATGLPVTVYTVTMNDGATEKRTDTTETSFIATGLTNGKTYTFVVTATDVRGQGTPSAQLTSRPRTTPAAPSLGLSPRVQSIRVYGEVQEGEMGRSDGGSPVTHFRFTLEEVSTGRVIEQVVPAIPDEREPYAQVVVNGLQDLGTYRITGYASNEAGESPPSNVFEVKTVNVPGAPQSFRAEVVDAAAGRVRLSWEWGHSGNSLGVSCRFSVQPGDRAEDVTVSYGGAETSQLDTVTPNGTAYTYSMWCTNFLGDGPAATATVTVTAP